MSNTAMIPLKRGHRQLTEEEELDYINHCSAENAWAKLERKHRRTVARAQKKETAYIRYRRMLVVRCIVDCAAAAALYALDAMAGWATLICACLSVINAVFWAKENAASGN